MVKKIIYLALLFLCAVFLWVMKLATYDMNGELEESNIEIIKAKKFEATVPHDPCFVIKSEKLEQQQKKEGKKQNLKKKKEVKSLLVKDNQGTSLLPEQEDPPDLIL